MNDILHAIVDAVLFKAQGPVLVYFLAVNAWYLVLLVSSLLELRRHMLLITDESRHLLLSSTLSPTISILAPAYNEEATIETSLRALLALQYPTEVPGVSVVNFLRTAINAHRKARGEDPINLKDFRKTVEEAMARRSAISTGPSRCFHRRCTILRTTGCGVRLGWWCGREDRSSIPSGPSTR